MKYFVVSDVHSFYNQLQSALLDAGFDKTNKEHVFVSCGDLLDRGDQSIECLNFVNTLPKSRKILIRGNHEDLLEDAISRKEFLSHDLHNGTLKTIFNLCNKNEFEFWIDSNYKCVFDQIKQNKHLYKYLNSLQDYAEVGNYIFVHGWIPTIDPNLSPLDDKPLQNAPLEWWDTKTNPDAKDLWKCARWTNGMKAWSEGCTVPDKTIVCGHWHSSWGNSKLHHSGTEWGQTACFAPFVDKGIIALDGCTAYSNRVNVVVLEV